MSKDPEKLESLVNQLLRKQPLRQAPVTLQERVLAQLTSRALAQPSRPWWRKGFAHWPLAARVAFLVASIGFVPLALFAVVSVSQVLGSHEVAGAISPAFVWLHAAAITLSSVASLGEWLVQVIPPLWLYGAIALGVVFYAVLFGLGTAAYRTLYVNK